MRIAVVGTGIAGLATAWLLDRHHDVTVFEAEPRIGGHANTVRVAFPDGDVAVDVGFIVYNEDNYPNLTRMFRALGVATQVSDMSFAASLAGGALEYGGSSPAMLFAQRRNLVRPSYLRMLIDIARFNRLGRAFLSGERDESLTLDRLIERSGFGRLLRDAYLYPMAAAIWSAPLCTVQHFPAHRFLRFFANHGLLGMDSHKTWRTVSGGSYRYVQRLVRSLRRPIQTSAPVRAIVRHDLGVGVVQEDGTMARFDRVVLACHADEALRLLERPSAAERRLLGAFRFQPNRAILHGDARLMPRRRRAWASWNYVADRTTCQGAPASVTYWMNRLQRLDQRHPLFVSLNPGIQPAPELTYGSFDYTHPVLSAAAIAAQRDLPSIQGTDRVLFAGAWQGDGFHEDGLAAALRAAAALGAGPPWLEASHDAAAGLPERAAAFRA